MLIIKIHNDSTGSNESANYNYDVLVNTRKIASGRIVDHNRDDGWVELVKRIVEKQERLKQ